MITPPNAHRLRLMSMLKSRGFWDAEPKCFAFSPGSDLLAIGGVNKTVTIWNLTTARAVMRLKGRRIFHENSWATNVFSGTQPPSVRYVVFADRRTLIVQIEDRTVSVWDLDTGREHYTLRGRHNGEHGPSDVYVHTGKHQQTARHWPVVDLAAAPSPNGEVLLVSAVGRSGLGSQIELRETRSGRLLHNVDYRDTTGCSRNVVVPPQRAMFSPDGTHFAVPVGSYAERAVEIRSTDHWAEARRVDAGWPVAFSPDGRVVAAAKSARVQLWDVATGQERWRSPEDLAYARNVTFSPSGGIVAAETNRADGSLGAVRCWVIATGRALDLVSSEPGPVVSMAFSPDGQLLAVARYWSLEVWEAGTARRLYRYARPAHDSLFVPAHGQCAFSPDGTMIALSTVDGLGVWRVRRRSQQDDV